MRYLRRLNKQLLTKDIFENLSSARTFLKKNNIAEDSNFVAIKELLKTNPGYIFTFTKFFYKDKASLESLKYLYTLIKQLGRKVGELPQQIDKYESYEKLLDDIMRIEEHTRFNKIVAELPANFKKEAREDDNYFSLVVTMSDNIYKDYYHLMKTKSFSFKTFDELYQATIAHTDSYLNMNEVLRQIEETEGAKLHYNKGNIVIAIIDTEAASKKLGSVSWCISSRGMWQHYNSPEKLTVQYFIWNFGVKYSSNDFRLGTTINPDGSVNTSHLKDDTYTKLDKYCETYRLDMSIFKPLSKEDAIGRVRVLKMTKDLFTKCVDLDIWKDLVDIIPFEWRLLRGLMLETDRLTPVQSLIAHGVQRDAIEFIQGEMAFEADYQRYMFLHRFNLEDEVENWDEIIDKILKPVIGDYKYNTEYRNFDFYINVEIPIEDYYATIDSEYASYIHQAHYYGITNDFFYGSEEYQYFMNYLNTEQKNKLISLTESLGIDLGDDEEKWYSILSKYGIDKYIDNFIDSVTGIAENNLEDMLKAEHNKLRFDYDKGRIEMGCEKIIELISTKFEKLNDFSIESIIESTPNDTATTEEYISMGDMIHGDDDIFKEGDSLINEIEEHIEDSDELKETVESYKKFRDLISKLGFEDDDKRITKETSNYIIAITKYLSSEEIVTGIITDKTSKKKRDFRIPLDELPTYIGNHKLDLFFESLKKF